MDMPIPPEDQEIFRNALVDRLKQGLPFDIVKPAANGDTFLEYAATMNVLNKLCEQQGIDPQQIKLRTFDASRAADGPDFFNLTAYNNKMHFKHWGYDLNNPALPRSMYARQMQMLSNALGLPISEADFHKVPGLFKTDKGPMASFVGTDQLRKDGQSTLEELKEKAKGSQIVVISQSGSFVEKRLSDAQVAKIAAAIKEKNPDAYIVVVSDKEFLRKELSAQSTASYTDFPLQTRFPIGNAAFQHEMSTDMRDDAVSEVLYPENINELLAYFYAADQTVVTDSFWAHAGAAANALKNDGVLKDGSFNLLFTLADPSSWGIAHAQNVQSRASERVFGAGQVRNRQDAHSVMPYDDYYLNTYSENPPSVDRDPNDSRRGIADEDVEKLIAAAVK